jgi:hypothetical protein
VDIDLPIWVLFFLPPLTMPGWALCSFLVGGALTYRWARGRERRALWAIGGAVVASIALPNACLLLLEAGAPAVVCAVTALAVLVAVLYLKGKPEPDE